MGVREGPFSPDNQGEHLSVPSHAAVKVSNHSVPHSQEAIDVKEGGEGGEKTFVDCTIIIEQ